MLVRQIASFVRSAGGSVFIEPKYLEGKRADAQIYFTSDISLMDVQITHPAAPYYAISTNIASTPLGTARSREIAKHSKYDKQAKSEGASFYPFVMETYGGLGKEASLYRKFPNCTLKVVPSRLIGIPLQRKWLKLSVLRYRRGMH